MPGPSSLLEQLPAISEAFSGSSLQGIYDALRARGDAWSQDTLATLAKCMQSLTASYYPSCWCCATILPAATRHASGSAAGAGCRRCRRR